MQACRATIAAQQRVSRPDHGWNTGGHSVWWAWTSTAATNITVEAYGDGFSVLLGVYKGSALNNLAMVATDDGSTAGGFSKVVFGAQPATAYFIAVDGKDGATGEFELYLGPSR